MKTLRPRKLSWVAAQPVDGPRETWDAWWAQRPTPLTATAARAALAALLPSRAWEANGEKPALGWLVPALCAHAEPGWLTQSPNGFRVGGVVFPTPLHALAGHWRDQGYAIHAQNASPETWAARRSLFETVMAALRPEDEVLLTAQASQKASEGFREVGSRLLGIAYRLEAWQEAERLEALGQHPDGAGGITLPSSMFLAGIPAWKRAVAMGLDPGERLDSTRLAALPRWRRWIGARMPAHNETNDPLVAHAVAWARQHDPVELKGWEIEGACVALRSAHNQSAATAAWAIMLPHLPEVLASGWPPLWFEGLANRPDLWAEPLAPYFSTLTAHAPLDLISLLSKPSSPSSWMAVPEPLRRAALRVCMSASAPPAKGLTLCLGAPRQGGAYTNWLIQALPPEWVWGTYSSLDMSDMAQVMGRVIRLRRDHAAPADPVLVAARERVPPDEWVPLVALVAHESRHAQDVADACAARPWSLAMEEKLVEMERSWPRGVAAVRASVSARVLDTRIDSAKPSLPRSRF